METIVTLTIALLAFSAQAQTYIPADCAVTYRQPGTAQLKLDARVGAPATGATADYSWNMAQAFTIPAGPIKSAKLIFPTAGTGYGEAGSATLYLTIIPGYDSASTCAGYGPGFVGVAKPKRDNDITVLAATVVTPLQTGDVVFTLNAKSLAILQAHAGTDIVLGVSMLVPRITIYPVGEDPKKTNQIGAVANFARQVACSPTQQAYCPVLVIQ